MKAKLTLTIKKDIIAKSKLYAKHTGKSLSNLVQNYLDALTGESGSWNIISTKTKKIAGAVKLSANFDEDTELRSYLEHKHL
ncbi:hypothetical protein HQ865_16760 [Mucilaginibacter mali]|uniref:Antitoxin n=1 Tax=Mucilaginibacter mali TaxID=2740462 RepID=A0A7D4UMR9_9SPHI|nr:DUF6364 family protein [Mucilaginibacter mali]QKJ31341.1 hypothetical protein HQ865_16760 [Mucilaginibacter mali]